MQSDFFIGTFYACRKTDAGKKRRSRRNPLARSGDIEDTALLIPLEVRNDTTVQSNLHTSRESMALVPMSLNMKVKGYRNFKMLDTSLFWDPHWSADMITINGFSMETATTDQGRLAVGYTVCWQTGWAPKGGVSSRIEKHVARVSV